MVDSTAVILFEGSAMHVSHASTVLPVAAIVPVHHQQPKKPELEDRLDVAGFKVKRSRLPPFRQKYEASHPMRHGAGDDATGVVVIDLDDIAPASSSHGSGGFGGGHLGTGLATGFVGLFLALYLGAKPAFEQIGESIEAIKELREDRTTLREQLQIVQETQHPLSPELRRNAQALLSINRRDRNLEYVKGTFAGGLAGSGMSLIGISILLGPKMFGLLSPALGAAAGTMLSVGSIFVPVFCSGMIGYEGYRLTRAHRTHRHVRRLLQAEPVVGNEAKVYAMLKQRIRRIEGHAVGNAISFAGLGVGAPLTTFLGPIGLSVLLPSVVGIVYASYYHGKRLHYTEQLAPEQKMRLGCEREIINRVELADSEYNEAKAIKGRRRLIFPYGVDSPQPVRWLVQGVAAVRRRLSKKLAGYAAPASVMFEFMVQQSLVEQQFVQQQIQVLQYKSNQAQEPLPEAMSKARANQLKLHYYHREAAELRREHAWLEDHRNRVDASTLPRWETAFDIMRFVVRKHLIKDFTQELLEDKKLRRWFYELGILEDVPAEREVHLDANTIIFLLTAPTSLEEAAQQKLLDTVASIAERVVLCTEKTRCQFRKRELLDALGEHVIPQPSHPSAVTKPLMIPAAPVPSCA